MPAGEAGCERGDADRTRLQHEGRISLVQLPHPGAESNPGTGGIRRWGRSGKSYPHHRTFLQSTGTYRTTVDGADIHGDVAFWGEWEGETKVAEEFSPKSRHLPNWLCIPVLEGLPPEDGLAQNTDPFVFGDVMTYTACRQNRNRKLRSLGRGSVILFGSRLAGDFVLDTVFVVAGYVDHDRKNFRGVLDGIASPQNMRMTLEPWYALHIDSTFRFYVSATAAHPVNGMFSFVPCRPIDGMRSRFQRPRIELSHFVRPGLAMQARTSEPLEPARINSLWREVADQVGTRELSLATRLDL